MSIFCRQWSENDNPEASEMKWNNGRRRKKMIMKKRNGEMIMKISISRRATMAVTWPSSTAWLAAGDDVVWRQPESGVWRHGSDMMKPVNASMTWLVWRYRWRWWKWLLLIDLGPYSAVVLTQLCMYCVTTLCGGRLLFVMNHHNSTS